MLNVSDVSCPWATSMLNVRSLEQDRSCYDANFCHVVDLPCWHCRVSQSCNFFVTSKFARRHNEFAWVKAARWYPIAWTARTAHKANDDLQYPPFRSIGTKMDSASIWLLLNTCDLEAKVKPCCSQIWKAFYLNILLLVTGWQFNCLKPLVEASFFWQTFYNVCSSTRV